MVESETIRHCRNVHATSGSRRDERRLHGPRPSAQRGSTCKNYRPSCNPDGSAAGRRSAWRDCAGQLVRQQQGFVGQRKGALYVTCRERLLGLAQKTLDGEQVLLLLAFRHLLRIDVLQKTLRAL